MAKEMKQITIGKIESEEEVRELIAKVKEKLNQATEELDKIPSGILLLDTLLQLTSKVAQFTIGAAEDAMKTKEARENFAKVAEGTKYTVADIEAILAEAKGALQKIPVSSVELLKLVEANVKNVISNETKKS